VIVGYVEPSGESTPLATAELRAVVEALHGRLNEVGPDASTLCRVEVPEEATLAQLASRLALARRTLVPVGEARSMESVAREEGSAGLPAAFRRLGSPGKAADVTVRALGRAYVAGGGAIDLETPKVRYWVAPGPEGRERLLREVAAVDRATVAGRAMPRLPFRRPVSLPPRLARTAVNLTGVRPGDTVLDPFLGTGSLLAEAALLGARVYGIDADPGMVRGALRNFDHLGVHPEAVVQGDARTVELPTRPNRWNALVTDPPYGRSSASVGADPERLVAAVLRRWSAELEPDGRVVVILPGGDAPLGEPWVESVCVPVRVHRSLTREFRVYRRRT